VQRVLGLDCIDKGGRGSKRERGFPGGRGGNNRTQTSTAPTGALPVVGDSRGNVVVQGGELADVSEHAARRGRASQSFSLHERSRAVCRSETAPLPLAASRSQQLYSVATLMCVQKGVQWGMGTLNVLAIFGLGINYFTLMASRTYIIRIFTHGFSYNRTFAASWSETEERRPFCTTIFSTVTVFLGWRVL
jgi:hypothetical protein